MDLESTIETVASYIPENLNEIISDAANLIPIELDFGTTLKFLLFFSVASLLLSVMGRVVLGKRSSLNHSLSSAMGILFIYAATIVIYTFQPWNLEAYLSPLPFVTFGGDCIVIFPFSGGNLALFCHEFLSLVILAFLVNLLDSIIPQGKTIPGWFILRFLSIVLSMFLHLLANWAEKAYIPTLLAEYAPALLVFLLLALLIVGFFNGLLSLVLTMVNPIAGGIYTFFFSNLFGKQITKAVFTSIVLTAIIFLLGYFGYSIISISYFSLSAYIPLAFVSLILWFLIGHLL